MAPERSRGTGATSRLPPSDGLRLGSFCFFLVGVRSVMWLVVSGGLIGRSLLDPDIGRSLLDPGGRELATQLSLEGEWLQVRIMTADCLSACLSLFYSFFFFYGKLKQGKSVSVFCRTYRPP